MSDEPHFLIEEKEKTSDQGKLTLASGEATLEPLELGKRVKEIRLSQNLTLEEASKRTGLARSTLSKIENEQISPTFAAVQKLVQGLGIDIPQLFAKPTEQRAQASGRRDITRLGEGKPHPTPTYEHELLATQLSQKKMIPYRTRVCAHSFSEYQDWVRHDGEEFLFVLSGSVQLYTEFYEPVELHSGDSAYYDCDMGHALVSTSEEDAVVLWVTA
ncbi:helix-turn-helix domain-containing protein [Marinobacterium arenosum]|uniref:helix-turn-helix domain-containing protein n=1 Tax=Marinobacterium arenosum TaxID=2862496 RepID=UPI001C96E7A5|nr:XRE family transcriptional regulator [Marinobacterium arenosum]MBY4675174.1 XRE family transcriptional regulator [Marinobacterium arenosum]